MLGTSQLAFNCSDCKYSLFEVVIKNEDGEWSKTQNYMTLDEYRRWEKKLGNDRITKSIRKNSEKRSVSYLIPV